MLPSIKCSRVDKRGFQEVFDTRMWFHFIVRGVTELFVYCGGLTTILIMVCEFKDGYTNDGIS